ncbi:MAG: outer membrane beta-barrel protein [Chitinispirillaceae bacterium]|nr:outer membrane beta-barrel protein [Chitinispirillaceae bacterium]
MKRILLSIPAAAAAAAVTAFSPLTGFSQGVKFQIGAGLAYEMPMGDYGGTTVDYYGGTKYGLAGGLNFHAKGRVGAAGFQLGAELGYASLSNSGNAEASGQGEITVSQDVVFVKLGPEYMINIPMVPLKPYVGLNLAFNMISGETDFGGVAAVPSGTYEMQSAARFGVGASGGVVYKLSPLISFDLSVSYNLLNLFGKKFEVIVNPARNDSYEYLNDAKDPVAGTDADNFIGAARSISTLQAGLSVMFGI